jgi:hypothetical protein
MEETYKHWKEGCDSKLADDKEDLGVPEGYEENKGRDPDFFIPVTDGDYTIHVLAPYVKLQGEYCLSTYGKDEPTYLHELFPPLRTTIEEEGEYPQWFFNALTDDRTYNAMLHRSLDIRTWGITAEFCRYNDITEHLTLLHTSQHKMVADIDTLQWQEEQSHHRLLGSHAPEDYALFCKIQDRPYLNFKGKGKFSSLPNSSRCSAAQF